MHRGASSVLTPNTSRKRKSVVSTIRLPPKKKTKSLPTITLDSGTLCSYTFFLVADPLQGDDENHAISDEGELITTDTDPPTRTGKAVRSMNDWWPGVKKKKSREWEKVNHTTGSTKAGRAWDTPKTPTRWEESSKWDADAVRPLLRDKSSPTKKHNHLHISTQNEQRERTKRNGISIVLNSKKDSEDAQLRDVFEISRNEVEISKVTRGGGANAKGGTQRDSEEESNDDEREVPDKNKISEEDEDTERDEDLIQGIFKKRNGSFVVERPTHALREEVEEEGWQVEVEWQSDPSDKKKEGEGEEGEGDENEGRELSDLPEQREEREQGRSETEDGIEQTDPPEKKEEGEQEEGEEEDGGSDLLDEKEDEFKSKLAQMTLHQRRSMAAQLGVPMTNNHVLLSDRMWVAYTTLKREIASEVQEKGPKDENENEEKEAEGEEKEEENEEKVAEGEEDEENLLPEDDEGIEGGGETSNQLAEEGEKENWAVQEVPSSAALCTEMPSHAREYAVAGEAEGALLVRCVVEGRQQDMWVKWGECIEGSCAEGVLPLRNIRRVFGLQVKAGHRVPVFSPYLRAL